MSSWRDWILHKIDPAVSSLFVVRDPDLILGDELVLESIRERGFEFVRLEDPIALRFAYESDYRAAVDRGEDARLVIATDLSGLGNEDLPFDILEHAEVIGIGLSELFPRLDPQVCGELEHKALDKLFAAYAEYASAQMGRNETIDFVLRHVFGVVPELVVADRDLLLLLLRRHYHGLATPEILDARLVRLLHERFAEWPLERLLPDREYFFAFLQERWEVVLDEAVAEQDPMRVSSKTLSLVCEGPSVIPFMDKEVCVYIDTLFLEGILKPIRYEHTELIQDPWLRTGIVVDEEEDQAKRFEQLIERLREQLPGEDARHDHWLHFARPWAEAISLLPNSSRLSVSSDYEAVQREMDSRFDSWLKRHFDALRTLPPYPPVMVHHIPRSLAREIEREPRGKITLLVVDGMAMDQWLTVRASLLQASPDLAFHEEAVFAWIPSTTSVSRQALFSGLAPQQFASSIDSTQREAALWATFWQQRGMRSDSVAYLRGLGSGTSAELETILEHPKLRILGLVIDKVDKIMHGMQLGTAGMHNQIGQWMQEGYMLDLVLRLLREGFRVFITSDHGNIEAAGCGRIQEGVSVETRGERVRVYSDSVLREAAHAKCANALPWNSTGLPDTYFPLLASSREAFTIEGQKTVAHGGITLEEVVVPFVEVRKADYE